jgi:xanthine dehydrogenase FAD-binding subunit
MFNIDSYYKAGSVEEAIQLLSQNPEAIPLAGGTDVLVRMHQGNPDYRHVVDIHDVAELKEIFKAGDGTIMVGSGATFSQLMAASVINDNIPVLAMGAGSVGGPQVRNVATVGGNICNGAPSADSAAPLLVLNAAVMLQGPKGERKLPLHEFYQGPGRVDLQPAELMTGLSIAQNDYRGRFFSYYKYAMRDAMDIATIGCAASIKLDGNMIVDLRLAFTVAGPTPLRCWKTEEKARGSIVDSSLFKRIQSSVLDDLRPRNSWRADKALRQQIILTLSERVVKEALKSSGVTL